MACCRSSSGSRPAVACAGWCRARSTPTWTPQPDRRDPVDILVETSRHRISSLLPIRYGRMRKSPFAFLRGSAAVMAADLATMPPSGIWVQSCGDCHLANFGTYAAPDGSPVFDITDFDETLPAPFEWDLKRLAVSFVVDGKSRGMADRLCRQLARRVVAAYRRAHDGDDAARSAVDMAVAHRCDVCIADDRGRQAARTRAEAASRRRRCAPQGLSEAAGAPQEWLAHTAAAAVGLAALRPG